MHTQHIISSEELVDPTITYISDIDPKNIWALFKMDSPRSRSFSYQYENGHNIIQNLFDQHAKYKRSLWIACKLVNGEDAISIESVGITVLVGSASTAV